MMALSDAFNAAYQALLKTWGNATASEEQEQDKKLLNQQNKQVSDATKMVTEAMNM